MRTRGQGSSPASPTALAAPRSACSIWIASACIWMSGPATWIRIPGAITRRAIGTHGRIRRCGSDSMRLSEGYWIDGSSSMNSGMDKHPIGRDFFSPNRMFHLMFSAVQRDFGSASFLMISRRRELAPFERDELSTAAVLADHVGRAMRTHRALRLAGARTLTFERALERLSSGVVVTDAGLKVLHANSAGHATLEADDGVRSRLGRIALGDLRAQRQLEAAARRLSDPAGGVTDAELEVARPGRMPLRVSVFPAIGDAVVSVASRGQLLILFHDPEAPARSMVELGASVGLTPAEARVTACAAEAASVRQIAECLGLSENTIKTHLKAVYLKTETGSRAELVRWVLQRAPGSQSRH